MIIQTALLLPVMGQGSPQKNERDAKGNTFFIDPSVRGSARMALRKVMLSLAPEDRESVAYVDLDGRAYANHPWILRQSFRPIPLGNGLYQNADGIAETATPYPTGTRIQQTWTCAVPSTAGWKASGNGCVIERMTTIGQKPDEDFTTGSYLKNVRWSGCLIGTSSTSDGAWSTSNTGGFQKYPDDMPGFSGTSVITATYMDQSNETVNVACDQ